MVCLELHFQPSVGQDLDLSPDTVTPTGTRAVAPGTPPDPGNHVRAKHRTDLWILYFGVRNGRVGNASTVHYIIGALWSENDKCSRLYWPIRFEVNTPFAEVAKHHEPI